MSSAMGGLIRRMVVATCVLLVIVGAAFGVLLLSIDEQRETTRLSKHSEQLFLTADHVHRLVVNMQNAQQQFIITGDPSFLSGWQQSRDELPSTNAELQSLASNPEQQRETAEIASTSTSYLQQYSIPTVSAAQRGDLSVHGRATMQEGNRRINDLRNELGSLRASERQIIAARGQHAQATADREVTAVTVGLAGSALVIALVGGYQTWLMVQPIHRAAVMADRLASGDLTTRMPETGKAEIGQLEKSFNIMGSSLERSHHELEQFGETQTALRRIATLVAEGAPPEQVLEAVVEELGRLIGTDNARIVRYEPDGTGTVVAAWGTPELGLLVGTHLSLEGRSVSSLVLNTGRAARMDTYDDAPGMLANHLREHGIRAAVGAPINVEGGLWGVVTAATSRGAPLPADAEARLADYTGLIGTAIANTQARADLVASRARVVIATDQARRRIERDLHDGVQQRLVSLGLDIRRAQENVPADLPQLRAQLSSVVTELNGTLDDVREISRGVHPAILTERGLPPALNALARRSAVPVQLEVHLNRRLPEPVEVAAYYVVTEAVANAAKHSQAPLIYVGATVRDDCLQLTVRDKGVGGADPGRGSGLIGLADRVEALGGTMTVESPAGGGTALLACLPLGQT